MTGLSDEALVAEYRTSGQAKYLDELFGRYHARVGAWCFRITADRESAADLAQEVFVKVFRNLDSFRGTSKFGTWLYSIARNHCFNAIRARASRPVEAGSEALEPLPNPDAVDAQALLEKQSDATLLRQLMERSLSPIESQVMVLHYVEELPLDTITGMLRLTNSSGAKALVVSARRKLVAAFSRWKIQSSARK